MFETLFSKVALQLVISMISGGIGAALGRELRSLGAFILLFISAIGGIFVVNIAFGSSVLLGTICLALWSGVMGAIIGPAVQVYAEQLGWETVAGAFMATAGAMALCGLVASFSGINFGAIGGYLTIGLYGLIFFGIIGFFMQMGRSAKIAESLFGMVLFAGYFLFDFWHLANSKENTWKAASELTMNIYLNFLNFFLRLLELLAASKDDHAGIINTSSDQAVALINMTLDVHQCICFANLFGSSMC